MILTAGQDLILEYLAGDRDSVGDNIVVGVGATAANAGDTALTYQTASVTIVNTSFRTISNNRYLVVEGEIPSSYKGTIYEYGISVKELDNLELSVGPQQLLQFDSAEGWSVGNFVESRINGEGLELSPTAGNTVTSILTSPSWIFDDYDISKDKFKLAFDATGGISAVRVRFVTFGANYDFDVTPAGGYEISSQLMSAIGISSASDLSSISQVEVSATATGTDGTLVFDGMMVDIDDASRVPETLIVRGVLVTPFEVSQGGDSGVQIRIPVSFA